MFGAISSSYAVMPPSTSLEAGVSQKKDLRQELKNIEDRLESALSDLRSLRAQFSEELR